MSDKPKHCPWCGWHGDRICVSPGDTYRWMLPECPACGATPGDTRVVERLPNGTPLSDSPANYAAALEMWNTRASPLRPIETAPKDGRKIILFYRNRGGLPRTVMGMWLTDDAAEEIDSDGVGLKAGWFERIDNWEDFTHVAIHEGTPTHWQPLPEPPKD